jgi:hypothetical protein
MTLLSIAFLALILIILLFVFLVVHVGLIFVPTINGNLLFAPNSVFLGYSPRHKGVKCLEVSSGRVYISLVMLFLMSLSFPSNPYIQMLVHFFENKFFFLILPFKILSRETTLLMTLLWKILMLLTHLLALFLILCRIQLVERHRLVKIRVKTVHRAVLMALPSFQVEITVALDPRMIP